MKRVCLERISKRKWMRPCVLWGSIDFSVDVDRVLRLFQPCLMPRGSNINVQSEEKGLRPEKMWVGCHLLVTNLFNSRTNKPILTSGMIFVHSRSKLFGPRVCVIAEKPVQIYTDEWRNTWTILYLHMNRERIRQIINSWQK